MRVLVTGHLGYIGTVLTPLLQRSGYEVTGLDIDLYEQCTFGGWFPRVPNIRKDLRDVERRDLEGFDAVLHLAALSNDPLSELDPQLTLAINFEASVRLAELARQAGASRFVFSSSCSNYGESGDERLDETARLRPVSVYGRSKVLAEQGIAALATDRFCPIFLRSATAYGVSPRLRLDLVLNNLCAWAFTTGTIMLSSDGSPWRPIVHVSDIALAFLAALRTPARLVHNQAFNVGRTSENYRIRELANLIRESVPGCEVAFAEGAGPDARNYRVNCHKATRVLQGFRPRWNARAGARELLGAYRKCGLTREDLQGPRYQRIAQVRRLRAEGVLDQQLRSAVVASIQSLS